MLDLGSYLYVETAASGREKCPSDYIVKEQVAVVLFDTRIFLSNSALAYTHFV